MRVRQSSRAAAGGSLARRRRLQRLRRLRAQRGGWVTATGSEPGNDSSRPCSSLSSSVACRIGVGVDTPATGSGFGVHSFRLRRFSCLTGHGEIVPKLLRSTATPAAGAMFRAGFMLSGEPRNGETPCRLMTCIEDLRQAARRRVPRQFFDYAEAGSYAEQTLRANRADLEAIKLRQRILIDVSHRSHRHHHSGRAGVIAACPGADRAVRHAAWRRRNSRLPGGTGRRHSLHALDHVDLLDRGCGRGRRQAVLVSALRHEGSRVYPRADRAGRRGQMQRAGAHGRSANSRPAPSRSQERHDRAAEMAHQQRRRHGDQAGVAAEHRARPARAPSAISPVTWPACRTLPRCRNGPTANSTRP